MSEEFPLGSRGGIAVRHHFPIDGEYMIQVRLQRNSREYIRGLDEPHQLDVRLDGARLRSFTIGGEKLGESAGVWSGVSFGDPEQEHYERTADEVLEVRFPAKAGTHLLTVAFLNETTVPEEPLYTRMSITYYDQYKGGVPAVHTVTIGGPYTAEVSHDPTVHEKIFVCRPAGDDDAACARRILTTLSRRAYRRTAMETEIAGLMDFYRQGRQQGGFYEGIGLALEVLLAGPRFLFIVEQVPGDAAPEEIYQISNLELATRLSLFLWSSIPDDTLLDLAGSGRLSEPVVLADQIQRMLDDPRSESLVKSFAAQWLNLRNLNASIPNADLFPYFDENLKLAFQKESELFFEYILREDRPLLELLDADYTFLNERLAKHYGIPDVYGGHFRKVMLPDDTRGGILGQGSILTVTSYANRTSPVIRGKWVLENVLGAPPPPPPANVPGLREKDDAGKVLTMREQMEQHRANPVCASCHKVMDPLGFALENYDAIGRWRTVDAASRSAIDSSGALPDGTGFEGPAGLREALLQKRREDFILTAIEKLLTYALGREITYSDAPVMREIMRRTAPEQHKLSAIIKAIIESTPFLKRRAPSHADN
jgi:hypothetical protein